MGIKMKKMVIKTKSLEFMPFWLSVACFLNAGVWTLYGFLPFDPFMAVRFLYSPLNISLMVIWKRKQIKLIYCRFFRYQMGLDAYVDLPNWYCMLPTINLPNGYWRKGRSYPAKSVKCGYQTLNLSISQISTYELIAFDLVFSCYSPSNYQTF